MRIGIDIRMMGVKHGGIGRYVFEFVKNILLLDSNSEYFLFYNDDCLLELNKLKELNHSKMLPILANIRHYSFAEQVRLPMLLKKYNLDLVHFPNFNVPILYNKPFLVTIHDVVHHQLGGSQKAHFLHFSAYKKIINNAAKKSKKIITVSEVSKQQISKILNIDLNKIEVTYLGSSLKEKADPENVKKVKNKYFLNKPYFLFVGVLERKKNIVNLARAFDIFIQKYKLDFDLVFVGKVDKHYPKIKHQAMDIVNRNRLVFTGFTEEEDLTALYEGAYAYVSASIYEGFGLPGVEAMNFKLPLAVSNTQVFNEIYDNSAIYFNPFDPEDIASKLFLLANDTRFAQQLSENSYKRSNLFLWEKTARQTLEIYKQIISANLI